MVLSSYSKINLSLLVNSKQKRGLHNIQSYFCLINLKDKIKILDIFNAIDEKIKTTGCGNNPNAFCSGTNKKCLTHNFWENLEVVIGNYLSTVHLSDLVEEQTLVK